METYGSAPWNRVARWGRGIWQPGCQSTGDRRFSRLWPREGKSSQLGGGERCRYIDSVARVEQMPAPDDLRARPPDYWVHLVAGSNFGVGTGGPNEGVATA